MTDYAIHVWAGVRKVGRCDRCRGEIVWRVNTRGKWMPFNQNAPVLHVQRDDRTGATFEVLSRDNLHFTTCRQAPARLAKGTA